MPRPRSGRTVLAVVLLLAVATTASGGVAIGPASEADTASQPTDSVATQSPIIRDVVPASQPNLTGVHPIPVGETMLVRGVTNLRSDQNVIFVEITRGPDADSFDAAQAPPWGTDGVWTARIPVPANTTPGNYTIRADDGFRLFTVTTEFVAQPAATATADATGTSTVVEEEPAPPTTESATTATAEPATTATTEPVPATTERTTTATAQTTAEPTATTTPGQPGFSIRLAALALLVLSLRLVARRS